MSSPGWSGDSVKFGPVFLQPGVRKSNVLTLLYGAFVAIGLLTFLKTMQPYLFNVTLNVPTDEQGTVSGWLEVLAELVIIASIGAFGALADRIGRRPVFALGFALLAVGYALLPLAHSLTEFAVYRAVFALGASATGAMLATVLVDYPKDRSRESLTAFVYVMNGLGVVLFAIVVAKLPTWIQAAGATPVWAGRCTLFTVGAICLVSALLMRGLKPGTPTAKAGPGTAAEVDDPGFRCRPQSAYRTGLWHRVRIARRYRGGRHVSYAVGDRGVDAVRHRRGDGRGTHRHPDGDRAVRGTGLGWRVRVDFHQVRSHHSTHHRHGASRDWLFGIRVRRRSRIPRQRSCRPCCSASDR